MPGVFETVMIRPELVLPLAGGHPVWVVYLTRDRSLMATHRFVLKGESSRGVEHFKHAYGAMQKVSSGGKVGSISPGERQLLKTYALRELELFRTLPGTFRALPENDRVIRSLEMLNMYVDQGFILYKMPMHTGILDLEKVVEDLQRDNPDKSSARDFASALNRRGGLEKLGEVVAVDMFTGNQDRIHPGGGNFGYQTLVNLGNVITSVSTGLLGHRRIVGLDAFETASVATNPLNAPPRGNWLGWILYPSSILLGQFCAAVITDLNQALGPRNRMFRFTNQQRLDTDAAERLKSGMKSGRRQLREYCHDVIAGPNAPAGLQARLDVLTGAAEYAGPNNLNQFN